jgi:branched-chain amino acid transport system ATP-binding protein
MALLEATSLSKSFGGLDALVDLNFSIESGEILGVIGPNGAGKSTLFNVMTGIYMADHGEIVFLGKNIVQLPTHQIVKLGIGRTFQNPRVSKSLTVLENVMIGFHCRTKAGLLDAVFRTKSSIEEMKETEEKALALLEYVDLKHKAGDLAMNLSYGAHRRMEIASALATNPKLLLLDEPMAGMSAEEIKNNRAVIESIRTSGVAVLLIEHNMRVVMELCERILVLNFGKKIATGDPKQIKNNPAVIEAYLGVAGETAIPRASK